MMHQFAWVEQPFSASKDQWMMVRFNPLFRDEVERMLASPGYIDIAEAAQTPPEGGSALHNLDLLFAGKLTALSSIPLLPGLHLAVELDLFGEPQPLKAVAVVSRQNQERKDGLHNSSLRFLALSKDWQPRKDSELPQYLAWA